MVCDAEDTANELPPASFWAMGPRVEGPAAAGADRERDAGSADWARSASSSSGGAEAAVGFAIGEQALGVLGVDGQALGLTIGAELALVRLAEDAGRGLRPNRCRASAGLP